MRAQVQARWLSLPDAAIYTGLTRKTLRERVNSGQLRAYRSSDKPGSHYRIKRDDLDAMLEANPVPAAR